MSYPGGKAGGGAYQRIINEIPPCRLYVEPFLGHGAVMRHLRPAAAAVGCDRDPEALAAWAGVVVPGLELRHCCGIEFLRHAFGLDRWPRVLAAADPGYRPAEAVRFGGEVLDAGSCVVYLDPPYPRGSRKSAEPLYRYEMTDEQHEELLDVAVALPCAVLLSSYPNPRYEERLAGWRQIRYRLATRRGMATEVLWLNFPRPEQLHDYRYLGANKRQRERVRRRVRNWTAGLRRLPAYERCAILEGIADLVPSLDRAARDPEPPTSATIPRGRSIASRHPAAVDLLLERSQESASMDPPAASPESATPAGAA